MRIQITPSCPSAAKIAECYGIPLAAGQAIRSAIKRGFKADPFAHPSHGAARHCEAVAQAAADAGCVDVYGIGDLFEQDRPDSRLSSYFYLNNGDSYAPTLFYNFRAQSWRVSSQAAKLGG